MALPQVANTSAEQPLPSALECFPSGLAARARSRAGRFQRQTARRGRAAVRQDGGDGGGSTVSAAPHPLSPGALQPASSLPWSVPRRLRNRRYNRRIRSACVRTLPRNILTMQQQKQRKQVDYAKASPPTPHPFSSLPSLICSSGSSTRATSFLLSVKAYWLICASSAQ